MPREHREVPGSQSAGQGPAGQAARLALTAALLLLAAAALAGFAFAAGPASAGHQPGGGHRPPAARQEATPSPVPTASVTVDEYSGTRSPGPGAAVRTAPPSPSAAPTELIDTVAGDRAGGPAAATPAERPIVVQRDRGLDWTVPLLLVAAALTILGVGTVTAAVRSRE